MSLPLTGRRQPLSMPAELVVTRTLTIPRRADPRLTDLTAAPVAAADPDDWAPQPPDPDAPKPEAPFAAAPARDRDLITAIARAERTLASPPPAPDDTAVTRMAPPAAPVAPPRPRVRPRRHVFVDSVTMLFAIRVRRLQEQGRESPSVREAWHALAGLGWADGCAGARTTASVA